MSSPHEAAEQVRLHILEATEAGGKTYGFRESHDPTLPADWWFQDSHEGRVLFLVFYTLACRWSACTGCNLPSVSATKPVSYAELARQIDHIFAHPDVLARRHEIAKVIVSNNGSVLDEVTFPSTALMYLLARINLELPAMRVLSLETRAEYVDLEELEFLARAMRERPHPAELELAIGFEAFDDRLRNKVFLKGLSLRTFEELVAKLARTPAATQGAKPTRGFRLKCYFMQKPVAALSDQDALRDVEQGIDYLAGIATKTGVVLNLHLNPTYVAAGTPLAAAFTAGTYTPPRLADVARAALHARGKGLTVFVGLNDEGLAVPGGSFLRPGDEPLVAALEAFNRTQDYDALALALTRGVP